MDPMLTHEHSSYDHLISQLCGSLFEKIAGKRGTQLAGLVLFAECSPSLGWRAENGNLEERPPPPTRTAGLDECALRNGRSDPP